MKSLVLDMVIAFAVVIVGAMITSSVACASALSGLGSGVDLNAWARDYSLELQPLKVEVVAQQNRMSCAHVRYQLQQNEKLLVEALNAYQDHDLARFGSLWSLYQTGESLYKNSIAMRSSRFMTPILEVSVARANLGMNYAIKITPFHFEYSADEIPNQAIRKVSPSQDTIRVQLDYLDVCLGYDISIVETPCFDFESAACRTGSGGVVKSAELAKKWDSLFYRGIK
jgi:hypothetical protein